MVNKNLDHGVRVIAAPAGRSNPKELKGVRHDDEMGCAPIHREHTKAATSRLQPHWEKTFTFNFIGGQLGSSTVQNTRRSTKCTDDGDLAISSPPHRKRPLEALK